MPRNSEAQKEWRGGRGTENDMDIVEYLSFSANPELNDEIEFRLFKFLLNDSLY